MSMTVADPWAALGDRTRRQVLARVAQAPASVATIARTLPVSRPAVSQHLKVLKQAGLVTVEPRGRERIYALRPDGVQRLRAELDMFWRSTLDNFKRIAEATPVATSRDSTREDPS